MEFVLFLTVLQMHRPLQLIRSCIRKLATPEVFTAIEGYQFAPSRLLGVNQPAWKSLKHPAEEGDDPLTKEEPDCVEGPVERKGGVLRDNSDVHSQFRFLSGDPKQDVWGIR